MGRQEPSRDESPARLCTKAVRRCGRIPGWFLGLLSVASVLPGHLPPLDSSVPSALIFPLPLLNLMNWDSVFLWKISGAAR